MPPVPADFLLIYLVISTIGLGFVAIIWSRGSLLNVLLKGLYSGAAVTGFFISLKLGGLI